jgi:hypothetical protein
MIKLAFLFNFLLLSISTFAQESTFNVFFQKIKEISLKSSANLSGVYGELRINKSDEIFLTDIAEKKIFKFDNLGQFKEVIGGIGKGPGEYLQPVGLCLDEKDNIYVSDNMQRKIIIYTKHGKYLKSFYIGIDHWVPELFFVSDSLIIMASPQFQPPDAFLYKNIQFYSLNGKFLKSFFPTSQFLLRTRNPDVQPILDLATDRLIYAALSREFKIYVFDEFGNLKEEFGEKPSHFKEFEGFRGESDALKFLREPYSKEKEIFYKSYSNIDRIISLGDYLIISTLSYEGGYDDKNRFFYIDIINRKNKKQVASSIKTPFRLLCKNGTKLIFTVSQEDTEFNSSIKIGFFEFSNMKQRKTFSK